MKKILMLSIVAFLSGCSQPYQGKAQSDTACVANTPQEDAITTPETSYKMMVSCLRVGDKQLALHHFAVAGTVTWYDAIIRPGEKNTFRHSELMKQALSQLNKSERHVAWEDFNIMLRNRQSLKAVCQHVELVAETRRETQVFDDIAWNQAMEGYLHCPSK